MSHHLVDSIVTVIVLTLLMYVCLTKRQRIGAFSLFLVVTVSIHLGIAMQSVLSQLRH